jgi:hypothetical protein
LRTREREKDRAIQGYADTKRKSKKRGAEQQVKTSQVKAKTRKWLVNHMNMKKSKQL